MVSSTAICGFCAMYVVSAARLAKGVLGKVGGVGCAALSTHAMRK